MSSWPPPLGGSAPRKAAVPTPPPPLSRRLSLPLFRSFHPRLHPVPASGRPPYWGCSPPVRPRRHFSLRPPDEATGRGPGSRSDRLLLDPWLGGGDRENEGAHLEALTTSKIMEENGEDVAPLAAYISTDGSYTETVPMPNHSTLTAPSQDSSSATKSRRQPVWTDEETRAFIQVWGDDAVQSALASNYRTVAQFQWIADEMRAQGYNRDWEQCRERAKALRRGFKVIVDGNSNARHGRRVWPYFEELNRFLCIKRNLVVPRFSGSNLWPPVNRRSCEYREAQDAPYEPSPVGKSNKGTFEEPDGDCLLLPKPGSQQSEANMENQAASPAANSDISMEGSIGPGTPTDPLPSNDSVTAPNIHPQPLTAAERMRNFRCRQRKRRGDTLKELMEVTSQATS